MTESLFLDTDCLSTFLWVEQENLITQLYNGRIGIPQQVYGELMRVPYLKGKVDNLLKWNRIKIYQIDAGTDSGDLYIRLTTTPDKGYKLIDRGEAAAIVLTKQYDGILGSNNLSDILPYINLFNLKYRTSSEIMAEAFDQHLINEGRGNVIWKEMLNRNRKLPCDTFSKYLEKRS
jgi:hypothetical protein